MDFLSVKIVEQIEAYIIEDNLYTLAKCARENDEWIRLELLGRCPKLSNYNYDTILRALCSKQSNLIELSSFEPRCIRRRCQPLTEHSIQDTQTVVVVTGLPLDVGYEELFEFFNRFYPIKDIIKIYSLSNRFQGKIHVIFNKSQDALAFVQRSKLSSIIYANDQSSNGYPLVCQTQQNIFQGKSFSTRLNNQSTRIPSSNNHSVHQTSCLKSNRCPTEQILFCQNSPNNQFNKTSEYEKQKIVFNKYSYEFYIPNDPLKQIHQCIMISVLNPFCFTVQFRQDALEFDRFQRDINDFYNTIDDKQYFLTPNQIRTHLCVICSDPKSSKIWNRSQILDFDPVDNTVNLFYVDLGTWDEYVPINRLRHLTDRFHGHLVRSITCRLAHINPINNENDQLTWTDEATNQFLAVIEQNIPEIEFLSVDSNGCFYINLFVMNSGQYVCVNDYLIHIKKATADDRQNSIQSDEHDITPIHPVIALYNRFGEILQQSREESRTASISSSSMSSPSTLPRLYVKIQHINTARTINQEFLTIIFVHYKKSILIPEFNIVTLLKLINSNFNLQTIEQYAFNIRYTCIHITQESNFDIFTQLSSLIDIPYSNRIALYPLDFVDYILKHYNFRVANVFLALENAKDVQLHSSDLALWFTIDNEFRHPVPSLAQQPITPYRLPFSNRLINPFRESL